MRKRRVNLELIGGALDAAAFTCRPCSTSSANGSSARSCPLSSAPDIRGASVEPPVLLQMAAQVVKWLAETCDGWSLPHLRHWGH